VRRLGERLDDRDEAAPKALELPVSQRVPLLLLELGEDRVREPHQLATALGRNHQLGPAISLLRSALDVAELLELVDDPPDDLAVPAGASRQLAGPRAVRVEMGDDRPVDPGDVAVAGRLEPGVEPVLHGEQEAGGEDPEPVAPLLPRTLIGLCAHDRDRMLL
jgi:hypothetical protein